MAESQVYQKLNFWFNEDKNMILPLCAIKQYYNMDECTDSNCLVHEDHYEFEVYDLPTESNRTIKLYKLPIKLSMIDIESSPSEVYSKFTDMSKMEEID